MTDRRFSSVTLYERITAPSPLCSVESRCTLLGLNHAMSDSSRNPSPTLSINTETSNSSAQTGLEKPLRLALPHTESTIQELLIWGQHSATAASGLLPACCEAPFCANELQMNDRWKLAFYGNGGGLPRQRRTASRVSLLYKSSSRGASRSTPVSAIISDSNYLQIYRQEESHCIRAGPKKHQKTKSQNCNFAFTSLRRVRATFTHQPERRLESLRRLRRPAWTDSLRCAPLWTLGRLEDRTALSPDRPYLDISTFFPVQFV
ncbi:hypothetical protein Q5P01_007263 [Channa striata]|uniref:Uncharacterized protein n=1 Tax=Channa striata TaxID=64152 RepID=A0AA88N6D5_CHASR|nr:hypothetical protein Q5P01_007263 [Channa striata]